MSEPLTPEREAEIRDLPFTTGLNAACGHFDTGVERDLYRLAATHHNARLELLAEVDRLREALAASEEKRSLLADEVSGFRRAMGGGPR